MKIVRLMVGSWKDYETKTGREEEMWMLNPGNRHQGWTGKNSTRSTAPPGTSRSFRWRPWGEQQRRPGQAARAAGTGPQRCSPRAPGTVTVTLELRCWRPLLFSIENGFVDGSHPQTKRPLKISFRQCDVRTYVCVHRKCDAPNLNINNPLPLGLETFEI